MLDLQNDGPNTHEGVLASNHSVTCVGNLLSIEETWVDGTSCWSASGWNTESHENAIPYAFGAHSGVGALGT